MKNLAFPYTPSLWLNALGLPMSAAFTYVMVAEIRSSESRVTLLNGFLQLHGSAATAFNWALLAISIAMMAISLANLWSRLTQTPHLVITAESVLIPSPWIASKIVAIKRKDITGVSIHVVSAAYTTVQSIQIRHTNGQAAISRALLPSDQAFAQVYQALSARSLQ